MSAYYNENDSFAAQWLRNLIAEGLIAHGDVDERSIVDVRSSDLTGYTQCHFFAGIGGWSYALRLAGWPDDRPVWTGSCPCQPFSAAGKGGGFDDSRHLWPEFYRLICECRPGVVFGEQVASKDGLNWLDLVQTDMEAKNYAFAAVDLCAAGVGAPHIRQRLFWVADAVSAGRAERWSGSGDRPVARGGAPGELGDATSDGERKHRESGSRTKPQVQIGGSNICGELGDTDSAPGQRRAGGISGTQASFDREDRPQHGREPHRPEYAGEGVRQLANPANSGQPGQTPAESGTLGRPGPTNGQWRDADWLGCTDGKWRPVEPGTFPLASGVPNRVGSLRGYGNAIVPQVAAEFIAAYLDLNR